MKDYTSTDFEKKTYITRYIIDTDNNKIDIIYADNKVLTVDYSVREELRILNIMKKQVLYYNNFIQNAKEERKILKILKFGALLSASIGAVLLGYIGLAIFTLKIVGVFILPPLIMDLLIIAIIKRRFNYLDDQIIELNKAIKDYNKSMFYINNEKTFANERILRRDVINKVPLIVQAVVEERKSHNLDREVPSINLNNLENLSMRDLKKTYEASLQSHGPELVLKPVNKKDKK